MVLSFGEVLMDCFPDKNVIGGAPFNVAVHLKRLGEDSGIITKIGNDELGSELESILNKEGLNKNLQIDSDYNTGKVEVTLNNGQPSYNIHSGCGWEYIDFKEVDTPEYFVFGSLALNFTQNQESFKKYKDLFKESTFICDINLREPFFTDENIKLCLESADILKINDEELEFLGKQYNQPNVLDWLKKEYNITRVLLTEGAKGATLYWDDKTYTCKVKPVSNVMDTVGAGDSFTSVFIHGLLNEKPLEKAMQDAADFAGVICQTPGAVPTDMNVYSFLKS